MTTKIPRILQIGAGRFGKEHLKEWQHISGEGKAELAGIVVSSEKSQQRISESVDLPVFVGLTTKLLRSVDGVDIVTPTSSHYSLITKCLPHTNVLVEKPIASSERELKSICQFSEKHPNVLMVGHVFRFHPVVISLKEIMRQIDNTPILFEGTFTNPLVEKDDSLHLNAEFLHYFDIVDLLLEKSPVCYSARRHGWENHVSLQYPGKVGAQFCLGWNGSKRVRNFDVLYRDKRISCNFADNTISVRSRTDVSLEVLPPYLTALRTELGVFLDAIKKTGRSYPNLQVGARVLNTAIKASPQRIATRPKIAVIGGGIFGSTSAAELASIGDVTLFERHGELHTEASFNNQWRHHSGFHYARSRETIDQIKKARGAFDSVYGDAVEDGVDSYFCTAKSAEILTRENYLSACRAQGLEFRLQQPPRKVLARDAVSLSLLTDESIYNIDKLRRIAERRLREAKNVKLRLNTTVTDGEMMASGKKSLTYQDDKGVHRQTFDYVVNATYAGRNLFSKWFGFARAPLRFDLFEMPVIELPAKKVSVTVLDGPFCALISNGEDGMFSLSHIHQSLLSSNVTADGLPPEGLKYHSNWHNIVKHCSQYFPILSEAKYVESRFGLRTIYAYHDDGRVVDYDGRPTIITDHGFGCWSMLAGKILTSVANAREIVSSIKLEIENSSENSIV